MLKRFATLGVILISIFGLFTFSENTEASSAGPVIYQVQTGGSSGITQEFISVYNNTSIDVEVTGWCVIYSSSSDITQTQLGCLNAPDPQTKLWLAAHTNFTAASNDFTILHSGFKPDITFASGLADAGGHIKLVDTSKVVIDKIGYGTATSPETTAIAKPTSGKILQRNGTLILQDTGNNAADFSQQILTSLPTSGLYEVVTIPDVCPNIDGLQTELPQDYSQDTNGNCHVDVCQNIDGLQTAIPEGFESNDGTNCTLIPLESATLLITELLPNSAGTDTGNEFIEIYNPNSRAINLNGYMLELGPNFIKNFVLAEKVLAPGGYASFFDTQTGIVLPNTIATVRLTAPAGNVVNTTAAYNAPGDNMAWALIEGVWQNTNRPTPGNANLPNVDAPGSGGEDTPETGGTLAACSAGKFRNPETNRCKNIDNAVGGLTPCAADQVRNLETNRCRSVFSNNSSLMPCQPGQIRNPDTNRCRSAVTTASASLTPCSAGQERNPATNRCRKIGSETNSLKPCPANQERNPQTNRCRKKTNNSATDKIKDFEANQSDGQSGWMITGGVVAAAAGYGAWEWRSEAVNFGRRLRQFFAKSPID